jgi:hypothetical protein
MRTIAHRLERLETRAKEVAAAHPEPHTLRFISVHQKVVSTFEMATGKWTHFDPPHDRAEFEPMG